MSQPPTGSGESSGASAGAASAAPSAVRLVGSPEARTEPGSSRRTTQRWSAMAAHAAACPTRVARSPSQTGQRTSRLRGAVAYRSRARDHERGLGPRFGRPRPREAAHYGWPGRGAERHDPPGATHRQARNGAPLQQDGRVEIEDLDPSAASPFSRTCAPQHGSRTPRSPAGKSRLP